jgi:SulP family sulfate permease
VNSKNISQRSGYSAPLNLISNLLVQAAGVALVAIAVVVFTISFAAVAYSGDLTPFLDRGIGLVLLGTGISASVVGLTASTRGMVAHPQDAPLLIVTSATPSLLSAAAAVGAEPGTEAQFATFFAFLICSTMLTGLLLVFAGKLRLSFIVRYMPYPIIGGIIVSIGYLLIISSVSLIVQRPVDIYSLPSAFSTGGFTDWATWAVGALAIFTAQRWLPATAILPVAIISAFLGFHLFLAIGFHLFLAITGSTLIEAEAEGLLLGPFPEGGFLEGFSPTTLLSAKWIVVFSHLPILVVLAPITALTCLIHTQAICRVTGKEPDLDRDLISNGLANVLGGVSGNLGSFPAISTSVLGARFGTNNVALCIATSGLCFFVALYGADFFGALPRGLLAMVILYLGLDMLISTLVVEWRRLPFRDLAPSLAILGTTIIEGLFFGLAMGVALSVFLFVASYARLPFIRTETNLAVRRSIVERGEPERLYLADDGQRVRILEVTGYLFFGTANVLREPGITD